MALIRKSSPTKELSRDVEGGTYDLVYTGRQVGSKSLSTMTMNEWMDGWMDGVVVIVIVVIAVMVVTVSVVVISHGFQ